MSPFQNVNDALQSEIRFKLGEQDTVWVTDVTLYGNVSLTLIGPVSGAKIRMLGRILGSNDYTLTGGGGELNPHVKALFTGVHLDEYAEYFA